jgi:hypothetical protein
MLGEKLLNHMGDMTSLFIADCLKNMNMNGIRHEDLGGFK